MVSRVYSTFFLKPPLSMFMKAMAKLPSGTTGLYHTEIEPLCRWVVRMVVRGVVEGGVEVAVGVVIGEVIEGEVEG